MTSCARIRARRRGVYCMKIQDVMIRRVGTLIPDETLQEAAVAMRDLSAAALPVCVKDHVVGVLSYREIVEKAVATGLNPRETKVRSIMTEETVFCFEDQEAEDVLGMMQSLSVAGGFVLDDGRRLVGTVLAQDLQERTGVSARRTTPRRRPSAGARAGVQGSVET